MSTASPSFPKHAPSLHVFRLGDKPLLIFLAFLAAFTPLSTDLYLPALPSMVQVFSTSPDIINLTISLFMVCYALSMLIWGPLSDQFGRRPILFAGSLLYIAASLSCILATDVWLFIAGRCIQAIGGGAMGAVSMAIVKDVFRGKIMENMLATIQATIVIAPVVAPILGAFLLKIASWRTLFSALTACGVLAFCGTLFLRETKQEKADAGNFLKTFGRLFTVLGNRRFRWLLVIFSLPVTAFMSYLTSSSYIYENEFGLTPQKFSAFFACNASISVLGPLLYIRFLRDIPKSKLFPSAFLINIVNSTLIALLGNYNPIGFTCLIIVLIISNSILRPPTAMVLMNIMEKNSGTISSLIGSVGLLFGSAGMLLCSLPWPSYITAVACISGGASVASLLLWFLIGKKCLRRD